MSSDRTDLQEELGDELDRRLDALMRLAHSDTAGQAEIGNTRSASAESCASVATACPGIEIPGFIIERELARGGMGIVYQARDLALKRTVAVKLLRERCAPQSAGAQRFLEEAQIAGQLQHPGIPPIYQVGESADGSPFLAMKLIQGETLDAKIRRGDRLNYLALIEAIAQAVGFAHAHGVIHRDLKPANIMVGSFGEVQIMDWGLAKELRIADFGLGIEETSGCTQSAIRNPQSVETQAGTVLGTPAYMAPEQAAGEIHKVDERSDVFGLGAVLCAMLIGRPPHTGTDAHSVLVNASRGDLDEALALLHGCGAEREVIALCERCLAFSRSGRPADGNAVAQEVSALRGRAQEQARQAELDRARLEIFRQEQRRRRRVWLALAATLLLGLVVSSLFAVWANSARQDEAVARIRAESSEKTAKEQRALAQAKEELARQAQSHAEQEQAVALAVRGFLQDQVLRQADPWQQTIGHGRGETGRPEHDVTLRQLLDKAASEFSPETIAAKFPGQPIVQAEVLETIGEVYTGLGEFAAALKHIKAAGALRAQHLGAQHPSALANTIDLVFVNICAEQYPEAMNYALAALTRIEQLLDAPPPTDRTLADPAAQAFDAALKRIEQRLDPRRHAMPAVSVGLGQGALMLLQLGQALPRLQRMADACARRFGFEDRRSGLVRLILGFAFHGLGQVRQACTIYEGVLELMERSMPRDDWPKQGMREVLAVTYMSLGIRPSEQIRQLNLSLDTSLRVLGPDHPRSLATMNLLATAHAQNGQLAEAIALFKQVSEAEQRALGQDHARTLGALDSLADAYQLAGKRREALDCRQRVYESALRRVGAEHPETLGPLQGLARALLLAGEPEKAQELLEPALLLVQKRQFQDAVAPKIIATACEAYEARGEFSQAEFWRRLWLDVVKRDCGPDHLRYANELVNLAQLLMRQSKWTEAEAMLRHGLAIREQKQPEAWTTFNAMSLLGATLLAQGMPREAEPLLNKAYEGIKARHGGATDAAVQVRQRARLLETLERLVETHQALEQPAAVAKWRAELAKWRSSKDFSP